MCEKHSALPIIFEKKDPLNLESTKYCERCFNDLLQNKEAFPMDEQEENKVADNFMSHQ